MAKRVTTSIRVSCETLWLLKGLRIGGNYDDKIVKLHNIAQSYMREKGGEL